MASFYGKNAKVRLAARNPVAIALGANQSWLEDTAYPTRTVYKIADLTKQYLDPNVTVGTAISVEVDPDGGGGAAYGVVTDYVIVPVGARIHFNSARAASSLVRTQNGAYLPLVTYSGAKGWSLKIDREINDTTELGDSLWRTKGIGLGSASGSIMGFHYDGSGLARLNDTLPEVAVLSLQLLSTPGAPSTPAARFEFYAVFKGAKVGTPLDQLIGEDLEFEADGQVYLRTDAPE